MRLTFAYLQLNSFLILSRANCSATSTCSPLLEEAANIRGLHARRHEAELRLRSAESNLERLDDVIAGLIEQRDSLKHVFGASLSPRDSKTRSLGLEIPVCCMKPLWRLLWQAYGEVCFLADFLSGIVLVFDGTVFI